MSRRPLYSSVATVVGLDLSLRAAAACAIPKNWDHDMNKVRTRVVGYGVSNDAPELERIERLDAIATGMVFFCRSNRAMVVGIEDYAFSQGQSRSHALGELGGSVKLKIYENLRLAPQPYVASSARKTLLQKLPSPRGRKKGFLKEYVAENVRRLGGPTLSWTDDEIDAFVIANHALMVCGGMAMTFAGEEL